MLSEFNFNILLVHGKFVKLHDQSVSCTRTERYNVKDNGLRVNQNYESIFVLWLTLILFSEKIEAKR